MSDNLSWIQKAKVMADQRADTPPAQSATSGKAEGRAEPAAAQPPRGSLPDTELHGGYQMAAAADLVGGSLTATEPPANAAGGPLLEPHDGGCRCWPHVSQSDAVKAVAHAALMEYRSGSPRGVTLAADRPALDVERIRQTITNLRDAWAGDDDPAEAFIAEYARLGSAEDWSSEDMGGNGF